MTTIDPNVQAARVVGRRAELGWFDIEFIMYGCAYLQDGKVHYKVSSQAEDIYQFAEKAVADNIYASNVLKYSQKCAVPSGMRDLIANDVKKDLARELQKRYSVNFFEALNNLAEKTRDNSAAMMLWNEAEQLEGVFSEEKMDDFESVVHYAYRHHGIDLGTYRGLMEWIHEERKNMEDNVVSKDFHEKTIYGFAYEKDGHIKFVDNVLLSYIYEKAEQLEQEGYLITPILEHTYWHNQPRHTPDVMREFRELLAKTYNSEYFGKMKALRRCQTNKNAEEIQELLRTVKEQFGDAAYNTFLRYSYIWGA